MNSTRPYLIRAFYDWIVDNNCTPHIVVNADFKHVEVPREFVDNGQIVLNVSLTAVQGLILGDQAVEFKARFGGRICKVYAPVRSILAIYAKENGRGMVFAEDEAITEEGQDDFPHEPQRPTLVASSKDKINTLEEQKTQNNQETRETQEVRETQEALEKQNNKDDKNRQENQTRDDDKSGNGGKGKGKGGRGHLTLIK